MKNFLKFMAAAVALSLAATLGLYCAFFVAI